MVLPWLARKAGISNAEAESLWRQALVNATEKTGWVGGPEFWAAANAELLTLTNEVRLQRRTPHLVRLTRSQAAIGRAPLQALEDLLSQLRHAAA